jgi:hypothetical protein
MICRSVICAGARRYVEPIDTSAGLYRIAADPESPGALVAATAPICPSCGENLSAAVQEAAPAPARRVA